jgi:hypothetical protein
MSERVFYPDTNDVSSASKGVALSIAVFRFNALRFNDSTLQRSRMISFDSTVQRPAREWSRGDASEIDGQIERSKRAGANESKLSEFDDSRGKSHSMIVVC